MKIFLKNTEVRDIKMDRTKAVALIRRHLDENGLSHWKAELYNRQAQGGTCFHSQEKVALAKWLVDANDCKVVCGIVIHEVAHAVVDSWAGHGRIWEEKCHEMGLANPTMFIDHNIVNVPRSRFQGKCGCGKSFQRHRKPRTLRLCRGCKGAIVWVDTKVKTLRGYKLLQRS